MQVEYRLKLGLDEFVLKTEVRDEKEFFEKMAFYASLPRVAPGGSDDLKIRFRTTTKGYKYYSLVSEKEKMEYKFGQENSADGGLFPKGWDKLFEGSENSEDTQESKPQQAAPAFGSSQVSTKASQAAPQFGTVANMAPAAQAQPAATTQATPAPVATNPAVAAVANNVLSRFGVKTT